MNLKRTAIAFLATALLALVLPLALAGCGGGGGSGSVNRSIIGTWKLTHIASVGHAQDCPGSFLVNAEIIDCGASDTATLTATQLTFNAAGSASFVANYTYNPSTSVFTFTPLPPAATAGQTVTGISSVSADGKTLTITGKIQATTAEIDTFQRQ